MIYQADNLLGTENGDASNPLQLYINGKTGDVTLSDANDIKMSAQGEFSVKCNNYRVLAATAITETTQNKSSSRTKISPRLPRTGPSMP